MGFKDMLGNSFFMRVVLALWIVSSVFVVFLMGMIDGIVHGELYGFGLQFSYVWASPYWAFVRLVYVCLAVPSFLSVAALVFGFLNRRKTEKRVSKNVEAKPAGAMVQSPRENQNHMVISCPSCKRVFGKPLVMLDFSGKKTRLVNVCPYCNHVLGSADEKESDVDVRVGELNKRVIR
jgi:uncharacterized Zn-finger protein